MSLSSGEDRSSENIRCKGPEVGLSLAYLWNKDAFVAGMEGVRGSRERDGIREVTAGLVRS